MPTRLVRWLPWAACGAAGALVLAALAAWLPPGATPHSLCLTRRLLGIACAGCGMTRALAALVQGRWTDAVALHPLSPLVLLEAVGFWAWWAAWNAGWVRRPSAGLLIGVLLADAALLIAVWILRWSQGSLPA